MFRAALLLLAVTSLACGPTLRPVPKSSGSIAVSRDDALLYIADADHHRVTVLDTATLTVLRHVDVPRGPERVTVAPDGAVFVTSRAARTVSRLSREGLLEAQASVGAEPIGLAVDERSSRLYVANSMSGTVSVLDARSLESVKDLEVGGNPHAVAVRADGELVVTDFLAANVSTVSRTSGLREAIHPLRQETAGGCRAPSPREPAQAADVAVSPDGARVYVAHVQSRTEPLTSTALAFAVAPAVSTIDVASGETLQDPTPQPFDDQPAADFPATVLVTSTDGQCNFDGRGTGMDAPSSLVVDATGDWLFVADHNSNAVAVVSATRRNDERFASPERGIYGIVRVGARPTGIAVAADNARAWVHNALDYSVSQVELKSGTLVVTREVSFAQSELAPDVEAGRKLFYSAVDPRVTQPELGGLSCSSCHPDGRTDGLSWSLVGGGFSQRAERLNTPALWNLARTAPYAWDGALADLPTFTTHMVSQMGGDGLSRLELADITAYLGTLRAPDNGRRVDAALEQRGAEVFAAQCSSCHLGEALTDGLTHPMGSTRVDTPSLLGVAATGPWLHDGAAATLREAVRHPSSPSMSAADTDAVEAWLTRR